MLVGGGQVNQRCEPADAVEPVALMAAAARTAVDARVLEAADSIRVVNLLSWRYRDPGRALADLIGATSAATRYSVVGGNVPQTLVNQACLDIRDGRADVVLIAGAEAWRTRSRLRAEGTKPDWPTQDETLPPAETFGADVPLSGPAEDRITLILPANVYPLFEQALRIASGERPDTHRARIGELWASFSGVAEGNENAWSREHRTAEEIWRPGPQNRMVSWPYTKLLNSNNMVDQGAVVVLASAEAAHRLRIPQEQWVFPYAGTDAHDTYAVAERGELNRSPAIRIAGRRAMSLAGVTVDDLDHIDLYSCFPSAVQVAMDELGIRADRTVTVTGGLTFAGGPWNNYVTHAIAQMAGLLRAAPEAVGLVSANGGFLTKHSFGVYGSRPPATAFRWEDVQAEVDRVPTRTAHVEWSGTGVLESWTTPFDRDGNPEKVFAAVRTPDDARTLAVLTDQSEAAASVREDIAGAKVTVRADGTAALA